MVAIGRLDDTLDVRSSLGGANGGLPTTITVPIGGVGPADGLLGMSGSLGGITGGLSGDERATDCVGSIDEARDPIDAVGAMLDGPECIERFLVAINSEIGGVGAFTDLVDAIESAVRAAAGIVGTCDG